MAKGYIVPALGPSVFVLENKMRKRRSSPAALERTRGNDKSRRNERYPRKRRRRSFDPSLTGLFLASFSFITRILRPSARDNSVPMGPHTKTRHLRSPLQLSAPFLALHSPALSPLPTTPVSVLRNTKSQASVGFRQVPLLNKVDVGQRNLMGELSEKLG